MPRKIKTVAKEKKPKTEDKSMFGVWVSAKLHRKFSKQVARDKKDGQPVSFKYIAEKAMKEYLKENA